MERVGLSPRVAEVRGVVESRRDDPGAPLATPVGPGRSREVLAAEPAGIMVPRVLPILSVGGASSRRPPPAEASAGPAAESPTVVNVTIGRVEVRATADDAKPVPPRSEPRRATMSLHQYLRQRGGGR